MYVIDEPNTVSNLLEYACHFFAYLCNNFIYTVDRIQEVGSTKKTSCHLSHLLQIQFTLRRVPVLLLCVLKR